MAACRWLTAAVLVLGALTGIGEAIPRWMISPGVDRYRADPVSYAVAQAAYDTVWMLNDNPIGRLLIPGARVRRVWRDLDHCTDGEPGSLQPMAEYRAEVQTLTWFGIPGPVVHVWCGGWAFGYKLPGAGLMSLQITFRREVAFKQGSPWPNTVLTS